KEAARTGDDCVAMTSTRPDPTAVSRRGGALRRRVATYPVTAFCLMAFPLGWSFLALRAAHVGSTAAGYAYTYAALLGSALVVTWAGGGVAAVRRFLSRYLIWRLGLRRWAFVVLALPALTLAIAVATGTLHH